MNCREVRGLLPGFALGDLDAEPAQAVREHLEGCGACREASLALGSAANALKAAGSLPGSERRREEAVAAMGRAHDEEVERRLFPTRRVRWGRWVAAALLGVGASGIGIWGARRWAERPAVLQAVRVEGRADLFRAGEGAWFPLSVGGRMDPGDRLVTQAGAFVRFEIRTRGRGKEVGELRIDGDSSVARIDGRRIALDRGRLFLGLSGGIPGLVVSDTADNGVLLERGGLEAGLREVRAVVADWKESREGREAGLRGGVRRDAAHRLSTRVTKGSALLMGAQGQRLPVETGRDGVFDLGGKPESRKAGVPEGPPWWERD